MPKPKTSQSSSMKPQIVNPSALKVSYLLLFCLSTTDSLHRVPQPGPIYHPALGSPPDGAYLEVQGVRNLVCNCSYNLIFRPVTTFTLLFSETLAPNPYGSMYSIIIYVNLILQLPITIYLHKTCTAVRPRTSKLQSTRLSVCMDP